MTINIDHKSSTIDLTSFLKPYVSQSHLISSILYFIQILELTEISIFSSKEVVEKIKIINNFKTNVFYKNIDCNILAIDISYLKNDFVSIDYLKNWLNTLKGKKILFYDLFKESFDVFELSEYILLQDEKIPVKDLLNTNIVNIK